jgi:integrase
MNRRRSSWRSLTTTRIYQKRKRFYLFAATEIVNPRTGKAAKWHSLCRIEDGEERARQLAKEIQQYNRTGSGGDMPHYLGQYRVAMLRQRETDKPKEPPRIKLWENGSKELCRVIDKIAEAFNDFNVNQVLPVDVASFVDQWEGRRAAQVYLSRLSDFFKWSARKGLRADNPCSLVRVDKPKTRDRYITDSEYHRIRDALLIGKDGRKTASGEMVQCYIDLCYLLYQRTTEVRLLRWDQVREEGIYFKPTKTEASSGAKVLVPMTKALHKVLEHARQLGSVKGLYVIHTLQAKPYTTHGVGTAWERACERAGVENATLKDIRAKALTDAKRLGYSMEQIMVGAAHTDADTTSGYIKRRETPVSEVRLELPHRTDRD